MGGARAIPAAKRPSLTGLATTPTLLSLLLFAEIVLFGGNRTDLAVAFSGLWLLALALILSQNWARQALDRPGLTWIGLSFAVVLAAGGLSLTPYAIGGPHPVWTWVPGALPTTSIDPYLTLIELIKLVGLAAVFLIGTIVGSNDERAKSLIRRLLLFGLAYSLWAFADRVTNPTQLFGAARPFDPNRLSASLVSANTAATFFGVLTVLNLVDLDRRVFRGDGRGGRFDIRRLERLMSRAALPLVSLIAAAACLILTLSRGGLAATAAVLVIMLGGAAIARARQGSVSVPAIAIGLILAGVAIALFAVNLGALQHRTNGLGDDALARGDIFAAHWTAFNAARLSGYGLGTFQHVNAMIMNQANAGTLALLGAVHNVYLQWLEQAGVVGAVPMFVCIALIALQIARGAIRRRGMRSWLLGILGALFLCLLHGASDFALEVPAIATFLSLLLGVGVGLSVQQGHVASPRQSNGGGASTPGRRLNG